MSIEHVVVLSDESAEQRGAAVLDRGDVSSALRASGYDVVELDVASLGELCVRPPDVVFPVLGGAPAKDAAVKGFLDLLGIPYVGSVLLPSTLATCGPIAKRFFEAAGLEVLPDVRLQRGDAQAAAHRVRASFLGPIVLKAGSHGEALACIPEAATAEELAAAIASAWRVDPMLMLEPIVRGDHVACAVVAIGAADLLPLPPILQDTHSAPSGCVPGDGRVKAMSSAKLSETTTRVVQQAAVSAHRVLGCRDLSWAHFVINDAREPQATITEVTTALTPGSMAALAMAAEMLDRSFASLCDTLVRRAIERHAKPNVDAPILSWMAPSSAAVRTSRVNPNFE